MSEIQPFLPQSSPFDAIRRARPDGSEFWSARELMVPLGYVRWDGFMPSLERAMIAGRNSGVDTSSAFAQVVKVRRDPKLGDQERYDFELSRFACYLTAMNGDPRKPEIAGAQTYFAVRTREAETARPRELSRLELIDLARESELARIDAEDRADRAEVQVLELAPAARAWDELAEATGDYSVREAALILKRDPLIDTGQKRLFAYLREIGWIDRHNMPYQRHVECGRVAIRTRTYGHPNRDEDVATQQVRITPKGLGELHRRLGGIAQLPALVSEQVLAA